MVQKDREILNELKIRKIYAYKIYENLIKPIKIYRPLFIWSAVVLNVKRTKTTNKYFSSFCTLGRLILTNPLFVLDSKESLDQYLIFVSAWLNLRTQIHGMPRHSIR